MLATQRLTDDASLTRTVHACLHAGHQQLDASFRVLQATAPHLPWGSVVDDLHDLIGQEPDSLSPWLYLGYYRLGALILAMSRSVDADRPTESNHLSAALAQAFELIRHGLDQADVQRCPRPGPAEPEVVGFGDPAHAPASLWREALSMLQEGGDFVEDLDPPAPDIMESYQRRIHDARRLIAHADPELLGLMGRLQRLVLLAVPGPSARQAGQNFGGATAFFFRGASVINAAAVRTSTGMVEVLVHEYAHAELFALGQEQVLCHNPDEDRHPVLIRADLRPMHGIIHSLHVVSRVIGVIDKILQQPTASSPDGGASAPAFQELRARQQAYGLSSLAVIREHALLTARGQEVVEAAAWRLGQPLGTAAAAAL